MKKELITSVLLSIIGFVAYFYFSIFPSLQAQVLLQDQQIEFIKDQLLEIKQLLKEIRNERN